MKIILSLLASTLLLIACKKTDVTLNTKTLLQAKWSFNSFTEKDYNTNPPSTSTINFINTFADFRTDGKVYISGSTAADTANYTIINASYITIDGDTNQVVVLTSSTLQLKSFDRSPSGAVQYENTLNFSR